MTEKPFEYLKRLETGENFSQEIVNNWYKARKYVLEAIQDIAFVPGSEDFLHAIVIGDSPLMLSVVRHIALSAHFINYNEDIEDEQKRRRTIITIVTDNINIRQELEKEEYLCNLPNYCKYVEADGKITNKYSYIDIEIHITKDEKGIAKNTNCKTLRFSEENIQSFCESRGDEIYHIDTRKAFYAGAMYDLGAEIDNLPAEDIHCTARYVLALNTFQRGKLNEEFKPLISSDKIDGLIKIREFLSNIYCADCFETRAKTIDRIYINEVGKEYKKPFFFKFRNSAAKYKIWELNNEYLSKSEHARWVVEKLILGYSPFSKEQHHDDEKLFYDKEKRNQYRKRLKRDIKNPAHIDLCNYSKLRCIDPNALKYDSFLMLGIPMILAKIEKLDKKNNEKI